MAITEQQRAQIYGILADTVGEEGAEFLMKQGPPGGWEQFATKSDIAELAAEMTKGFADVDSRFADLKVEMATGFADLKVEMATGFADLNARMERGFAQQGERRSRDVWAFSAAMAVMMVTVVVSVLLAG